MRVYIDTSALYAVMDRDDRHHERSAETWTRLLSEEAVMLMSSYVLLEITALVQHRLGMEALDVLYRDILPIISVHWVSESEHRAGISAVLAARRRKLSLVDCTSFEVMRRLGLTRALALDRHFEEQGFEIVS